ADRFTQRAHAGSGGNDDSDGACFARAGNQRRCGCMQEPGCRLLLRYPGADRGLNLVLCLYDPPPLAAGRAALARNDAGGRVMRFLEDDEADDPILAVVNLVDLFLVITAVLMVLIVRNPLNPFQSEKV